MQESYNETLSFLYGITEGDIIGKENYEKFVSDKTKFSIDDFVSNVYVSNNFLENRSLFAIKHYRYSLPNYHTQKFLIFNCVLEGEFEHIVEGVRFTMKKGDICLMNPNVYHAFDIAEQDEEKRHKSTALAVLVSLNAAQELFSEVARNNKQISEFIKCAVGGKNNRKYVFFRCSGEHGVYRNILQLIFYEARNNYKEWTCVNEAVIRNLFRTFVSELILSGNFTMQFSTEFSGNSSTVDIVKYIYDNYRTVTLGDVAQYFNYCTAYASRLIKKRTGMKFATLISEIRFRNANELLLSTDMKISDIAEKCGFGSTEHFFRNYKEKFGCTPTQFRNCRNKTE